MANDLSVRGGVDVSSHKETIDWPVVATAWLGQQYTTPISFAWLRATEGVDFVDSEFYNNVLGCSAAGLEWGAYHFATPGFGSVEQPDQIPEARDFLATIMRAEALPGATPCQWFILDVEKNNAELDHEAYAAWIWDWMRHVHSWCVQHGRRRPAIYISQRNADRWLPPQHGLNYWPLWVPDYSERPPRLPHGWDTWTALQETSSGQVDGIDSERVDCNILRGELWTRDRWPSNRVP
jgi:lysozyme